jgi:tetratricopeptide (TPR) repeat protein
MLRGDFETAERLYRDVLARRLRAVGPAHSLVALDQARLAELLTLRGQYEEAERLLEQSLTNLRSDHTDTHVNVRRVFGALAELYDSWGKTREAERYHRLARGPSQR